MEKKNRQPLNQPLFQSDYITDKVIGYGGMSSEVYLVHKKDKPTEHFAAKVIYCEGEFSKDFVRRFGDEAITNLRVRNKQNLVQTYEVFPTSNDEALVFIMDYINGISLNKYMDKQGCIGVKAALSIFRKICIGVKELHSFNRQIIHRDLKPENILLSKDLSKVTLIDFGIASVVERTKDYLDKQNVKTYTGDNPWGTGPYVIPDYLVQGNIPSVQYDFFSLGVILYRMIMGKIPFDQTECKGNQAAVVKLPTIYDIPNISSNPTIPVAIENIIFKCMASKKEDLKYRYNDIQEIIDDVDKARANLGKKTDDKLLKPIDKRKYQQAHLFMQDAVNRSQKWYKRWWVFLLISFAFLAVLVVAIVVLFVLK